jgi:hypothetical protein
MPCRGKVNGNMFPAGLNTAGRNKAMNNPDPVSQRGSLRNPHQPMGQRLMAPGTGTPWEDRDSLGIVSAFLRTCIGMLTAPANMLDRIRRLEDRADARLFAIACTVPWFCSFCIHSVIVWRSLSKFQGTLAGNIERHYEIETFGYFLRWGIGAIILCVGLVLLQGLAARIYFAMVRGEDMKGRGTAELVYSMYAYCLAPSIVAVVPFVGPPLALGWGLALTVVGGMSRLRVGSRGAAVAAGLAFAANLAILAGALCAGYVFFNAMFGNPVTTIDVKPFIMPQ